MYVEETGSGDRTVVAIHGWGGTHRDFTAIARHRPAGYRFLSVDLPACGSSAPPDEWNIEHIVRPVRDLVLSLAGADATLVGFCSGATIALLAAAQVTERVSHVVAIDPLVRLPWYFAIFTKGEFGRRAYASTFMSPLGRRVANAVLQRKQTSEADFTAAFVGADHGVTQNYLRVFSQSRGVEPFRGLSVPVDICFGEKTFGAVRRSVSELASALPNARVHELAGSGHLPLVRSARKIAAILSEEFAGGASRNGADRGEDACHS